MKSGLAKHALSVAAFVIAFVAVKYGMHAYREHQSVAKVEQSLSQLQVDATQKHPDVPVSVAVQQEATERASKKMAAEPDDQKRANTAADMFWGFYFINVRERPEFCRVQGADIQLFVKAFERIHTNEFAKAKSLYVRSSADENKLYALLKPQLHKMILQDMNDVAATNKISLKAACTLLAENADALVKEMHFSKVQPAVYQALSSTK